MSFCFTFVPDFSDHVSFCLLYYHCVPENATLNIVQYSLIFSIQIDEDYFLNKIILFLGLNSPYHYQNIIIKKERAHDLLYGSKPSLWYGIFIPDIDLRVLELTVRLFSVKKETRQDHHRLIPLDPCILSDKEVDTFLMPCTHLPLRGK